MNNKDKEAFEEFLDMHGIDYVQHPLSSRWVIGWNTQISKNGTYKTAVNKLKKFVLAELKDNQEELQAIGETVDTFKNILEKIENLV